MTAKLCKAEQLLIAAYAIPRLRTGITRRIKIVDTNGKIVRETCVDEVVVNLLIRAKIETDIFPPDPTKQELCAGFDIETCKKPVPKYARSPHQLRLRNGRPWRCQSCAGKVVSSRRTPEQKKKLGKLAKEARACRTEAETAAWRIAHKIGCKNNGKKKQKVRVA